MKYIKPLLFILAILYSTVSVAHISNVNSISWNREFDTIQTVNSYTNDPIKPLNQELLLNLSKGNELASIFNTLPYEELSDKRNVVVTYNSSNLTLKLEGKLLCVSEKGVFIYSGSMLTFVPYKSIKFISKSLNFGKQIGIAIAVGSGIGFINGLTDSNWPVIMGVVYGVYGAALGGFYYLLIGGPINLIVSASPNFKFKILFDEENGKSYYKMINENNETYGYRMQIKDYPGAAINNPNNSNVPQNQKDTILITKAKSVNLDSNNSEENNNNIVIKTDGVDVLAVKENPVKDTIVKVVEPVKITPPPLKIEFPKLNTPSGKINPKWMYLSFNKLEVNEKKLLAKFKNIQGTQLIAENLQNLNPSEIQYLAITIATLNGYNFRNIVSFTESQNLNLKNYESYISSEVKGDSEIDPSNLQELDLNNIYLIYSVLKEKTN